MAVLGSGGIVNLIEYPAVARNDCCWPLQVMASHSREDISEFVACTARVRIDLAGADGVEDGEDGATILAELGYDEDAIKELLA